jgi:protein transport protein SEC24
MGELKLKMNIIFFFLPQGTDKEKSVLTPQCKDYNTLGQDCVGVGCTVDMFLFNNAYIDVATISQVSFLTRNSRYFDITFLSQITRDTYTSSLVMKPD